MRVLVTGAAGRIGRSVTAHLLEKGHEVVATDVEYHKDMPVKPRMADLLDRHAAYGLLDGCDALVHLANHPAEFSISPMQRLYAENVAMSMNVLYAAAETGLQKIVYASSIQAVCSRRKARLLSDETLPPSLLPYLPFDTQTPAAPGNGYALSKAAGEEMMEMISHANPGISCTSIRYPAIVSSQHTYKMHFGHHSWPVYIDEGLAYLTYEDSAIIVEHVLRANLSGHKIIMPAADDNRLGLTASELLKLLYKGVPLKPSFAMEGRTVFDLAELKALYGWEPKFLMPRQELLPEFRERLQALLR